MADKTISDQMLVEHEMLKHLMDGLRKAIDWKLEGDDFSRKRATICFMAQALNRHLDHLLALEEHDGYMDAVVKLSPQMSKQVDSLKEDHAQFRKTTQRAVQRLDHASSTELTTFHDVCQELLALLENLHEHTAKEMALLQEAFQRDSGGEG
jgi:hemerythrin-like domain-containing protein